MKLLRWLLIFALTVPALAQNTRFDLPIYTVQAQGGNLLPVYAIPGAGVVFYSCTSATPPVCTTLATTYISAASSTTCPTNAQVVLNGTSSCVSSADPYGNMGGWFQSGQYMATITGQGSSYNYLFTVGGGTTFTGCSSLSPGINCPAIQDSGLTNTNTGVSLAGAFPGAGGALGTGYSSCGYTQSGGTCSSAPVLTCRVFGGGVYPVIVNPGTCTVPPTVVVTGNGGTGATLNLALQQNAVTASNAGLLGTLPIQGGNSQAGTQSPTLYNAALESPVLAPDNGSSSMDSLFAVCGTNGLGNLLQAYSGAQFETRLSSFCDGTYNAIGFSTTLGPFAGADAIRFGPLNQDGGTDNGIIQSAYFDQNVPLSGGWSFDPSFTSGGTTYSLFQPYGIDFYLTGSGQLSYGPNNYCSTGPGYTGTGTCTLTGGTLLSGTADTCSVTTSGGSTSPALSGTGVYSVQPIANFSGFASGSNYSCSTMIKTPATITGSIWMDVAGTTHVSTAAHGVTGHDTFTVSPSGNVTLVGCGSGEYIKGDGTGCGSGATIPGGPVGAPVTLASGPTLSFQPDVFDAAQFSGGTSIAQIQACLAAALASGGGSGGGICDSNGLSTTAGVTSSTGFTVGNVGGTSTQWRLPVSGSFQGTMTGGTTAMLTQYPNTSIIGPTGSGIANKTQIGLDAGSSATYEYNYLGVTSGAYGTVDGLAIYNNGNITSTGIGSLIQGTADGSSFLHMAFEDNKDTYALKLDGTCCGTTLGYGQVNSSNIAGHTPLWINDDVHTIGKTQGLNLISETVVHAGPGLPEELITDTTGQPLVDVHHFGTYYETSSTDTTTTVVSSSGAKALGWSGGITIHCNDATQAPFLTTDNTYNTVIHVENLDYGTGGTACGASGFAAIVNGFTGHTVTTDSSNNVGMYQSARTWLEALTAWELTLPNAAAGSGTNCLQINTSGVVSNTGSACGSGGGGSISGGVAGEAALFGSTTTITAAVPLDNAASANQYACSTAAGTSSWNACSFPTSSGVVGTNGSAVPVAATSAQVAATLWTYASNSSATGGTGTGTVTCLTATCTNLSGSYSVVGGTFTTGNLLVLVWPTTTTAYKCSVVQNGGATNFGLGHTVATATGMTITNAVTVAGVTASFDYICSEY